MAFSTFRGFMGAATGSGPSVFTDTITPQVHTWVYNRTAGTGSNPTYAINSMAAAYGGTANQVMTYSKAYNALSSFNYYTWMTTLQTAGPSLTTTAPLGVNSGAPISPVVDIAGVSSTNPATVDQVTAGNITISSINTADTTLVNSASHAPGQAITALRVAFCGGLQVAAMVLADTTSLLQLYEVASASYKAAVVGPTDISKHLSIVGVSNTMGVIIYKTAANLIKLATFNITGGGTGITIDSAVSSGITAASGAKAYTIDSTHILFVYKKTTDTLAARVVTVATGSTFTFNTESTAVATGITDDPIGNPGRINSGDYGVTWINSNGQGCCTLMSVSGTAVTLSNANIYHTANNVIATTDYYSSYFIGISSTNAIIVYLLQMWNINSNPATSVAKAVTVDVNYSQSSNNWGATWTGNSKVLAGLRNAVFSDVTSVGTDRYVGVTTDGASSSVTVYPLDNDYNKGLWSYTSSFSSAVPAVSSAICNLGFTGTTARAMVAYGYSNTDVHCRMVRMAPSGTMTISGDLPITLASNNTGVGSVNLITYAADKTLVVYSKSTGIYGAVAITSGTSIMSLSSETQILSNTGTIINIGLTLLDSSGNILLTYCDNGTNAKAVIINMSGTTLTTGTPVTIGGGSTVRGSITSCLHTSSRGSIVFYDSPGGTPDVFVRGFTYSGTTLTLGAADHNVSQNGTASVTPYKSNKPNIISVGNNEALVMYQINANQLVKLITTTAVNTYTIGTQYSGANSTMSYAGFLPQDCYHKVASFNETSNTLVNFYRV